jgi:large subunit ribosomal protein L4
MQVPVRNTMGEIVNHIEISDDVFAVPFREALVHQAMARQLANARVGTASVKTRGEVSGSTRKPFRQKGTGRARRGTMKKSPLLRGGGIVFGPHPRSYRQRMPKKMRRLALRCVLSAKANDEELTVMEQLNLAQPDTKEMAQVLKALGLNSSVLIVTSEPDVNIIKSARNLHKIKTLPAALLNVLDILSHRYLLMTVDAVHQVEQIWSKQLVGLEKNASV